MSSVANSLAWAERSPIMTAAPGSVSPDQRLPVVYSCPSHESPRSQNRSTISPLRLFTPVPQAASLADDFPDELLEIDPERPLFENSASETKDFRRRNSPKTGFPDRSLEM